MNEKNFGKISGLSIYDRVKRPVFWPPAKHEKLFCGWPENGPFLRFDVLYYFEQFLRFCAIFAFLWNF